MSFYTCEIYVYVFFGIFFQSLNWERNIREILRNVLNKFYQTALCSLWCDILIVY